MIETEAFERVAWVREQYPRLSGDGWFQQTPTMMHPGFAWTHESGLKVLAGGGRYDGGKRWLHVSLSRYDRIPDYEDMKIAKEKFLGRHKAVQIFPVSSEHVNIHPNCLHLWACIDGDGLPDFTRGIGAI